MFVFFFLSFLLALPRHSASRCARFFFLSFFFLFSFFFLSFFFLFSFFFLSFFFLFSFFLSFFFLFSFFFLSFFFLFSFFLFSFFFLSFFEEFRCRASFCRASVVQSVCHSSVLLKLRKSETTCLTRKLLVLSRCFSPHANTPGNSTKKMPHTRREQRERVSQQPPSILPLLFPNTTMMIIGGRRPAIAFLLGLFLAVQVSADDNNEEGGAPKFNLEDMMGNKPCPTFRCSAGYTPTPKTRLKFESAGCNSIGSGMALSGQGEEAAYSPCCDQYLACLSICGISKKICDDDFKTCSDDACGEDKNCKQGAQIATMMSKLQGCQKFDEEQLKSCACVETEKATESREAVIRNFYKKYSPESVKKAADLAKKASTTSKMAGLLRKLVKKYPESIKKVVDPQQEAARKWMDEQAKKDEAKKKEENSDETDETEDGSDEHVEL